VEASECTTPLDVPITARVGHRHGILDVTVADQPREHDGTYLIEDVQPEGYTLTGLEPEAHDSYLVAGLTEGTLVGDVIEVRPGETTNIQIYYYNAGAAVDDTATIMITFRACPEGVKSINMGLAS
jgi:hypothetical protein